jgi:hypothetical protein
MCSNVFIVNIQTQSRTLREVYIAFVVHRVGALPQPGGRLLIVKEGME